MTEPPPNLRTWAVPARVTLGDMDMMRDEMLGALVAEGTRCPPWLPFPGPEGVFLIVEWGPAAERLREGETLELTVMNGDVAMTMESLVHEIVRLDGVLEAIVIDAPGPWGEDDEGRLRLQAVHGAEKKRVAEALDACPAFP